MRPVEVGVNLARAFPVSIRGKLLFGFVGLALVPTLVVGVWAASAVASGMRTRALSDLASGAQGRARAVEMLAATIEDDLRYLAAHPTLRQFREASRPALKEAARAAAEATFLSFSQGHRAYWQLRYIDGASGRETIRVDYVDGRAVIIDERTLQDRSGASYVREGLSLAPGEVYISSMEPYSESARPDGPARAVVRYVLALGDEARADGLLVANLFAEHLFYWLDPLDGHGRIVLLDDRGTYLASSGGATASPSQPGARSLADDEPPEVADRVLSGESGSIWAASDTAYRFPRGVARSAAPQSSVRRASGLAYGFEPVGNQSARAWGGRHWVLAVAVPEKDIVGAAARGGNWAVALGALLSCLLAAGWGVLYAWHLSGPVQDLSAAADRVARGDFSTRVTCKTNDEIEHLADRFNEMTERLGEAQATLARWNEELRTAVDERTRQLAQEKEKLAGVVAGMEAGLVLLSRDRHVEWANRTLTNEYGDAVVGASCAAAFKCVEPCVECPGEEVLRCHRVVRRLVTKTGEHGEPRHVQIVAAPVHDATGEVMHVVGLFTDVTEAVRREEAVFRAERLSALGLLSASISHEVANPLAAIKTSLQALLEGPIEKPRVQRFAQRAVAEVDRLTVFLRSFATFARPRPPERKPVELGEVVRDAAALVEHTLGARHLRLTQVVEHATAMADGSQIRQVLLNLLLNAIEASPDRGLITLEVRTATLDGTPAAAVEVADEGAGMDENTRRRIFDPFFSTKSTGSGLGLSVAHQIVTEHDGRIEVETAVGSGARFRVLLPAAPEPAAAQLLTTADA